MYKITAVIILILTSCANRPTEQKQESLKDSVIKNYLKMVDTSSTFHDTLDYNFKILKAYVNNDSAFFKRMKNSIEAWKSGSKDLEYPDTCIHLKRLSDLPAEEAYRFKHSESFCPYSQIVTVTRSKNIITLDYLEFSNGKGAGLEYNDGRKIPTACTVVKQFQKQIVQKEWNSLERMVHMADYYGMKPYYSNPTTDGSWWEVIAYKKDSYYYPAYYSVYRHSPYDSDFCAIGKYMMELSGAQKMCGELF